MLTLRFVILLQETTRILRRSGKASDLQGWSLLHEAGLLEQKLGVTSPEPWVAKQMQNPAGDACRAALSPVLLYINRNDLIQYSLYF